MYSEATVVDLHTQPYALVHLRIKRIIRTPLCRETGKYTITEQVKSAGWETPVGCRFSQPALRKRHRRESRHQSRF
jgi:rRNA maturation protein Nop10